MSGNYPPLGIGILIALASLIVSVLAWLSPFSPVGPSPLRVNQERSEITDQPTDLTRKSSDDHRKEARDAPRSMSQPTPPLPLPESPPVREEVKSGDSPGKEWPSGNLGNVIVLREGTPYTLAHLKTVMTVSFRETLGSRYAEIVIAPLGKSSTRFPARRAGVSENFYVGDSVYELQVMSLDLNNLTVKVVVNSTAR